MAERRRRIEDARARQVCPNCEKPLSEGAAVGTAAHRDGLFCSLECLTMFHEEYFEQRRDWGIPSDN